jgi:FeoC like transcriptional regulator
MLSTIREFIQTNQMVSKEQIAREFYLTYSALEPILELLILRKEIRKIEGELCGKRCGDCEAPIYYEWLEKS